MSWLLHPEPFGSTPFRQGRECQRLASGKFLYQVWSHQLLGGVSCFSIVGLNKSHFSQRWRKKDGVYLSGKPDKHSVKAGKTGLGSIPVSWVMEKQVSAAKTRVESDSILGLIDVEETCPASIGNDKHGKAPVLVVQSTISCHQTLSLSNALSYE